MLLSIIFSEWKNSENNNINVDQSGLINQDNAEENKKNKNYWILGWNRRRL